MVNKVEERQIILTSVPLYIKPAVGFSSFGYCNWSESLSWHIISSFSLGIMLIDVHVYISEINGKFLLEQRKKFRFICNSICLIFSQVTQV